MTLASSLGGGLLKAFALLFLFGLVLPMVVAGLIAGIVLWTRRER